VAASSATPCTYQWRLNGSDLADQTAAVLRVTDAMSNGTYAVVVSNTAGIAVSAPAVLTVLPVSPVPWLSTLPLTIPGQMPVALNGEAGRWYRFEISTNLVNWSITDYVLNTNSQTSFQIATPNPLVNFVRSVLDGNTDGCRARLEAYRAAGSLWAIENHKDFDALWGFNQLAPYLPLGNPPSYPTCPAGGTYSSMSVGQNPWCSLHSRGHYLTDSP
jgi:hypothetical protein